nr:cytochrome P450 89A2-like [Ipomoea batatas]
MASEPLLLGDGKGFCCGGERVLYCVMAAGLLTLQSAKSQATAEYLLGRSKDIDINSIKRESEAIFIACFRDNGTGYGTLLCSLLCRLCSSTLSRSILARQTQQQVAAGTLFRSMALCDASFRLWNPHSSGTVNPKILIANHSLAHQALVQNGAVFSDRPRSALVIRLLSSNQRNISSAAYGPTWRLLRRNLTSEILQPSRLMSYSNARQAWVLGVLVRKLLKENSGSGVKVIDHFQYAMLCLLVLMCFGDKLEEQQIRQIEESQRKIISSFSRFNILNSWPTIGKILFRNRWEELKQVALDQVMAYVDTLIKLEWPEENRKLSYGEMATLCGEFLNGGTDTTSTALQWIMANLVKHPSIQATLYEEILGVIGAAEEEGVKEEDLQRMPYLKAPHTVSEEVELEGYVIPKNSVINFTVADLGWDPTVWEDPMEFKPERFLSRGGEAFDLSGSREIKMMLSVQGGEFALAWLCLLHLEYFVANLVWLFQWKGVEGDEVDLAEKQVFTTVMKHPLRAHLYPRNKLI